MLKAHTQSIKSLSESEKEQLFILFKMYYDKVEKEKFIKDLMCKENIIILSCKSENKIRGFSTLQTIEFSLNGNKTVGIFSGDTIIDENFWGATALTFEFLKNVLKVKAQNPFKEVFWLLISKGFKTYLLLANNFQTYYPRYDKKTPERYKLFLDHAWKELYPDDYDKSRGLLKTAGKYDRLKGHVSQIGPSELSNPKIAFFNKSNPLWSEGDELCCIGRIDMGLVCRYCSRTLLKVLKKRLNKLIKVIS